MCGVFSGMQRFLFIFGIVDRPSLRGNKWILRGEIGEKQFFSHFLSISNSPFLSNIHFSQTQAIQFPFLIRVLLIRNHTLKPGRLCNPLQRATTATSRLRSTATNMIKASFFKSFVMFVKSKAFVYQSVFIFCQSKKEDFYVYFRLYDRQFDP